MVFFYFDQNTSLTKRKKVVKKQKKAKVNRDRIRA